MAPMMKLVRRESAVDHIGVVNDVTAEKRQPPNGVDQIYLFD